MRFCIGHDSVVLSCSRHGEQSFVTDRLRGISITAFKIKAGKLASVGGWGPAKEGCAKDIGNCTWNSKGGGTGLSGYLGVIGLR